MKSTPAIPATAHLDVILSKDELAILRYLYHQTPDFWDVFRKDAPRAFSSKEINAAVGLSVPRLPRAISLLARLELVCKIEVEVPNDRGTTVHSLWWITNEGVMAYRKAAPREEWDAAAAGFVGPRPSETAPPVEANPDESRAEPA